MPDGLYEQDFLIWSETQVSLLRRLAGGERVNALVDWANLIEEVGDLGRSELSACESLLLQAMAHLLKLRHWPDSAYCGHWRSEMVEFLAKARRKFTPSMRQRLDLQDIYGDALRILAARGGERAMMPKVCPFTLDDLLARETDFTKLLTWPTPPEDSPC